jgi:hypothetical protein
LTLAVQFEPSDSGEQGADLNDGAPEMSDLIQRLKQRNVEKRSIEVSLDGRVLYLVDDPAAIQQQLEGQDLSLNHGLPYRDNISTDEMTPAYVCY